MPEGKPEDILVEYDAKKGLYEQFTDKVETLLVELLKRKGLQVHSVMSRVKARDSLEKKLAGPGGPAYEKLADVPDISGIRITTYLASAVPAIAEMLEAEFELDRHRSEDKRDLLDPDRFGYVSLHEIVRLSSTRCRLPEWEPFASLSAEIQIRSILQHAWAEIEHDLGYKSDVAVPRDIRRRFSRLAGLLELADDEFIAIRDAIAAYTASLPERIEQSPGEVLLDSNSLEAFIESSPTVAGINQRLLAFPGVRLKQEGPFYILFLLSLLRILGHATIRAVESDLAERSEDVVTLGHVASNAVAGNMQIATGFPLQLLCLLKILQRRQDHVYAEVLCEHSDMPSESAQNAVRGWRRVYDAAFGARHTSRKKDTDKGDPPNE